MTTTGLTKKEPVYLLAARNTVGDPGFLATLSFVFATAASGFALPMAIAGANLAGVAGIKIYQALRHRHYDHIPPEQRPFYQRPNAALYINGIGFLGVGLSMTGIGTALAAGLLPAVGTDVALKTGASAVAGFTLGASHVGKAEELDGRRFFMRGIRPEAMSAIGHLSLNSLTIVSAAALSTGLAVTGSIPVALAVTALAIASTRRDETGRSWVDRARHKIAGWLHVKETSAFHPKAKPLPENATARGIFTLQNAFATAVGIVEVAGAHNPHTLYGVLTNACTTASNAQLAVVDTQRYRQALQEPFQAAAEPELIEGNSETAPVLPAEIRQPYPAPAPDFGPPRPNG